MFKKFTKLFLTTDDVKDPNNIVQVINKIQASIADSFSGMIDRIQMDSTILTNVQLKATQLNIINHTLNRTLLGWKIVRKRSPAVNIYDTQDTNPTPKLTLQLQTTSDVIVDIEVF